MIFEKIRDKLYEYYKRYADIAFIEMNTNGHTLDFEYAKGKKDSMGEAIKIINQVEAEYNNGWIPCSVKMPADCEEDWVQVQIREKDTGFFWIPRIAEYRSDKWWLTDSDEPLEDVFEVIAWQPLPQPPKGE